MQRQKFPERHTGLGFPRRVFDADSSSTHGFFPFSTVSFKVDTGFIHSFIHSSRQERLDADGENKKATRRRTVTSLHGDLPQIARDAAIASLRAGECDVLVATDVAARGLDLPGVELVVHADLPRTADAYAHRAGRAGRPGCAVRGASLLLPPPGPEHAAHVARMEREAKIAVRRLTAVGEREARGRSVAAAVAASAAAASRSFDGVGGGGDGVVDATSSSGVRRADAVSEEDARGARARLGERMLVADRFGEFTGELSELRGDRSAGASGGKSKGKAKGRRR